MSYQRLVAEHDRMEVMIDTIIALTEASPAAPAAASRELVSLATLVRDHLREEDELLYRTIAKASQRPSAEAEQLIFEFEALKADWGDHIRGWGRECIAADWNGLRQETAAVLTAGARGPGKNPKCSIRLPRRPERSAFASYARGGIKELLPPPQPDAQPIAYKRAGRASLHPRHQPSVSDGRHCCALWSAGTSFPLGSRRRRHRASDACALRLALQKLLAG